SHLHIDEPITFELWIAILIVQQPKDVQLSSLKISNQEKATIKKWITLIQTLPKIQSKQSLITLVYDYNLKDIEILLSLHHLLKQNGLTTANQLIINEISIREANKKLPIHCRKELAINGKDILNHTNKNSGPWLKDTLREIEIAVISNQIANTKEEILEWVDAHVKI
ncbi:MAG: CCA tRNA nucleotidyltransferase, partial [Staphylococcus epidermidis]|nr:CCA tRNA nucleotidyltransferase [Staphylococcus epidermidis]